MIYIGTLKSMDTKSAVVHCPDVDAEITCMVLQLFANATDTVFKVGDQVAIYAQNGRNILLGAVYGTKTEPSLTSLLSQIVDILKTMKVSTPSGTSGTPLPDVAQKITALENDFKTLLNVT